MTIIIKITIIIVIILIIIIIFHFSQECVLADHDIALFDDSTYLQQCFVNYARNQSIHTHEQHILWTNDKNNKCIKIMAKTFK